MKNIFFLIRSLHIGGAERQLVNLIKSLDYESFKIYVAYFYDGGALEVDLKNYSNVYIINLNKKGRWDLFGFILRLVKILNRIKPDVLYTWLNGPNILGLICGKISGVPYIIWGIRYSNIDLKIYGLFAQFTYWLQIKLSRFIDRIIVNSFAGATYHKTRGFPGEKIQVIQNGIDTSYFKPMPDERKKVRKELGIEKNEVAIGIVGRLDPVKDHQTFFQAAYRFCEKYSGCKFICIGSGNKEYKDKLFQLVNNLKLNDKLIWLENRDDMPSIYNALDILTSTSLSEGFSNVIAEAMACQVLCVATDVGDSRVILGNSGYIIPKQDPNKLLNAWEKIINLHYVDLNNLKKAARERIINYYELKRYRDLFIKVINLH